MIVDIVKKLQLIIVLSLNADALRTIKTGLRVVLIQLETGGL